MPHAGSPAEGAAAEGAPAKVSQHKDVLWKCAICTEYLLVSASPPVNADLLISTGRTHDQMYENAIINRQSANIVSSTRRLLLGKRILVLKAKQQPKTNQKSLLASHPKTLYRTITFWLSCI